MSHLPFGTALALAQRTLTAPLAAILDEEGIAMTEWFTLNALGLRGPARIDTLVDLLAPNGLDDAAGRDQLARMLADGLIAVHDGTVSLTPAGTARYTALRDRIGQVTRQIFGKFDPGRVETARSLLQEIADSDPAVLAR